MDGSFWSWSRGGGAANDDVVASLTESTTRMAQDVDALKQRLYALETTRPPTRATGNGGARRAASGGADAARDAAVPERARPAPAAEKRISWRDSSAGRLPLGQACGEGDAAGDNDEDGKPPIRRIKFRDQSSRNAPSEIKNDGDDDDDDDDDAYDSGDESSAYSSEDDPIAFAGWARVFFQARRDRAATQVTAPGSTPFLDTHLHLVIHATANQLRISDADDRQRPLLIDPPISLRHFYAARVPGSRSGAALFLRNDKRRLRKYVFRFEFPNRAARQSPQLYAHFSRSGAAAKNSRRALHKVRKVFALMGEERREQLQRDTRRGEDALAAHLATLDELLRESDEAAERFVECVNARNEEEESARHGHGRVGNGQRKRAKPLPPYWGSGYNRLNTNKDELDADEGDSESADSEEEEELDYDDDDETTFDKVKVSTEQTLETLWKHIVK